MCQEWVARLFDHPVYLVMFILILTSIHVSFNIFHPFHRGMITVSYQCLNCVLKTNNHHSANVSTIHLNTLSKFPDLSLLVGALRVTRIDVLPLSSWESKCEWERMFTLHIQDLAVTVTRAIHDVSNLIVLTTNTATALFNFNISPAVTDRIQLI
jgi:hypothetical protein